MLAPMLLERRPALPATRPLRAGAISGAALMVGLLLISGPGLARERKPLLVFAAASTTSAMTELGARFERHGAQRVALSFAASSTLARQIVNGARPALFLSANPRWTHRLREAGLLAGQSRGALLGNRLALIRRADDDARIDLDDPASLLAALGDFPLVLGDPAHVPAGIYARQSLEHFGLWQLLAGRMAFAANARAVTARVARGEAALGIAYASDLRGSDSVAAAAMFPVGSHAPIRYELALVAPAENSVALDFYEYLFSQPAQAVFKANGFTPAANLTHFHSTKNGNRISNEADLVSFSGRISCLVPAREPARQHAPPCGAGTNCLAGGGE